MTVRVLVIDDSSLMRSLLSRVVIRAPDIEVIGTAPDPIVALDMIKELNPDVLTLDVEMPRMNGMEFLSRLMKLRPMPVVMISSSTAEGSAATLLALELGAVEVVGKPKPDSNGQLADYSDEICDKIRAAYEARHKVKACLTGHPVPRASSSIGLRHTVVGKMMQERHLIAIGASTGGTEAIRTVLQSLPAELPGIVMVQHMPELFTGSFAKRLDGLSRLSVHEARDGDVIRPGHAYLAPGSHHMRIRKSGNTYMIALSAELPVNRHRPSVDVLFESVAEVAGRNATGIILTGMGKDGAAGLLKMRSAGAWTIGQDKDSCVVYGMPREAAQIGAIEEVAPLMQISDRLLAHLGAGDPRLEATLVL